MAGQRIAYVRCRGYNFGDNLNDWLFAEKLGVTEMVPHTEPLIDGQFILGIGSLFNAAIRLDKKAFLAVFGSGCGYFPLLPRLSCRMLFLRGPLSCDWLGVSRRWAITDGAYALADDFIDLAGEVEQRHDYGLIPHHRTLERRPRMRKDIKQVRVIDPQQDSRSFIREVASCRKIVTECLHGAILADILGIPFTIIQIGIEFHSFKWLDWLESIRLPFTLNSIDINDFDLAQMDRLKFYDSEYHRRRELIQRVQAQTEKLRALIAAGDLRKR